jgi:hypothetical protein
VAAITGETPAQKFCYGETQKKGLFTCKRIQHVMDSYTGFCRRNHGDNTARVDLVLNSLASSAIGKGLGVLRPHGRFLEIGKRDIYHQKVGLPFQKNLSYLRSTWIDELRTADLVGRMLRGFST